MRLIQFFLWAAIALGLYGCGGGSQPPETVDARGRVHLEAPVVGATVELQDLDGHPLPGGASTHTSASGTFVLPVDVRHIAGFRVVASGGTYEGKPFKDRLSLEVENFDARQNLLYVNALTSLVSLHQLRNPGRPLTTVSSEVHDYLQIPFNNHPAMAVDNPHQDYFRHEILLAAVQASATPTLGGYLDHLQVDLATGTKTRTFARASTGSIASSIGQFAAGLVHKLEDETFAWMFESILTTLGMGGTSEILNELHEIKAKLDELTKTVDQLKTEIKEEKILTGVNKLIDHISMIDSIYQSLLHSAQVTAGLPTCQRDAAGEIVDPACAKQWAGVQAQTNDDILTILNSGHGVAPVLGSIQMTLLPTLSQGVEIDKGLLKRWFELFKDDKPFFAPVVDPRLEQIKIYYQAAQYMGTRLLVEAAMAGPGDATYRNKSANRFAAMLVSEIQKQDELVASAKLDNPDVVIEQSAPNEPGTGRIWLRAPLSNMTHPSPAQTHSQFYSYRAEKFCESKAHQRFAGYDNWRQPTDAEYHKLVNKPGSPTKGGAQSGAGAFAWLVSQGFQAAQDPSQRDILGIVPGSAYFSSTGSGIRGTFFEALWDDGVDFACTTVDGYTCGDLLSNGHQTGHAGAMCVVDSLMTE